ncbi:MAG: hypothetical protein OXI71_01215 [Gemmatimonadota bacterium]|nr:hypothetical protein [Gemmatimonadota bacterium]
MKTDSGFGFSLAILWSMFKVAAVTIIVGLAVYLAVYFSAPDRATIHPSLSHRVALEGRLRCRIDFFRKPPD